MDELLFFDQSILKIEFLFKYAGINVKSGEQSASNRFKSRLIFWINFFWLNTDISAEILYFIDGLIKGKDFLDLTYIAPCIFICTMANCKAIFLIIHEKYVHKVIDNLRQLEKRDKKRTQSLEKKDIMKHDKKFLDLVSKTFNILCVVLVISFCLSPLATIAVKYYQTNELELMLPCFTLYPFDPFQIKVWPFVFLHQFWSVFVAYTYVGSADLLFFVFCTYIRMQFRLLQHDLENIVPHEGNTSKKFVEDEDFKKKLKDLIMWHQDLIESANTLEIIYSKSALFNFLSSAILICLTGFNVTITVNGDLLLIFMFLSFLFVSLGQIFFVCYFADLMMSSSTEVNDSVYNSLWYTTEAKIQKKLLIVLTRSQSPCKITASGFADVNLKSFMRVLSSAYSYFALLQTMYRN